jgi:hypothetical protein
MLKLIGAIEIIGGLLGFGFLNAYVWPRHGLAIGVFSGQPP